MLSIHIKDRAVDQILEETIAAFYEYLPDTAKLFEDEVRASSASLVDPTGVSADGTMLSYCKIPSVLWSFLKWQGRKRLGVQDFFKDKHNFDRLCKIWRACAVKRRPSLHVKVPKEI